MIGITKYVVVILETAISLNLLIQGWRMVRGKVYLNPTMRLDLWLVKKFYGPEVAAEKYATLTSPHNLKVMGRWAIFIGILLLIVPLVHVLGH